MTTTTPGTISTSALNAINGTASTTGSGSSTGSLSAQDQSDRFLKLLVAQMQNQDPMNPMDSAQVTSQMAQISTVEGLTTLNTTVTGLNSQFLQMQSLQGAALVGHTVATEGNALTVDPTTQTGKGGFEIASAATSVKVDVLDPDGKTIDTIDMGAQTQGRHDFSYAVPTDYQGKSLTFKVTAVASSTTGTDVPVDTMSLTYNRISAVSNLNGSLALELDNGTRVAYDAVWAFI